MSTRIKQNMINKLAITTCIGLFAINSSFAQEMKSKVPSNASDSFVTKTGSSMKIDLGATIEIDAKGYPTQESQKILYDEMDYQGAVSAYLQSIPQVSFMGQLNMNRYYGATGNTDSLVLHNDPATDGQLTPNRVVTYIFNFADISETGPMVYEAPAGPIAGIIADTEMRWYTDFGLTSPYQGNRLVKYLILTEDQDLPENINKNSEEYVVVRIKTNRVWFAFRNLNPVETPGLEKELKIYLYSEREKPETQQIFSGKKK